ncbi:MAG: DUF3788 family protein [Prolixibacteraceae bacterium]|nr:DUF3788 family protein [Prolixibacteraceae bacterium]
MEPIVLTDPNVQPTDELVFSIIGENSVYWENLIEHLYEKHLNITEEWRFYNDGKSWLYRALQKKETLYWIGVIKDTFRISFWFGDKVEPIIEASSLPEKIKEEFRNAKRYGKIRAVSIEMRSNEDLQNVILLLELKVKMK